VSVVTAVSLFISICSSRHTNAHVYSIIHMFAKPEQTTHKQQPPPKKQPCPVPNGAAGLALLGKIYRKTSRKQRATKFFQMSLQLDPFLWTSFEALAEMGEQVDPASVFGVLVANNNNKPAAAPIANHHHGNISNNINASTQQQPAYNNTFMLSGTATTKTPLQPKLTPAAAPLIVPASSSRPPTTTARGMAFETPGLTPIPMRHSFLPAAVVHNNNDTTTTPHTTRAPVAALLPNTAVVRRARQVASRQYYPPSPETPLTNVTRSMRYLHGLSGFDSSAKQEQHQQQQHPSGNEARSLFLSSENKTTTAQHNRGGHPSSSMTSTTTPHNNNNNVLLLLGTLPSQTQTVPPPLDPLKHERQQLAAASEEKIQGILECLSVAGAAYQLICQYKCREALRMFQLLPARQQTTGWVLHQQGRAYLELNDFVSAQRCLEYMLKIEPGRMKGLDMLSTVYWQLKKEVELASLAQQVVDWDRLAPEAWCVVGNCFSLQKDHESALVFFLRSLQIDPDFTYTHTLSGHEYLANEDFDKATACFRQALRTDDRHYNAWYGLGTIYHRQEKFDLAEYHFERACSIHPSSSVLHCNLGVAQYSNGKAYQALETLSVASRLDPRNPQARYQRSTIYSALHRPEEALAELEKVLDVVPREATIHFAMGKVLKRLGRSDQAMKYFLTAMDLDPKDNQMIKSAMDKLDDPEVDEETLTAY
jgi:anaphase-promoting complex subunit 3